MARFISLHSVLLTIITVVQGAFQFTSPTAGSSVNLSSSSIDIQWTSSNAQYSQVNPAFTDTMSKGTTAFAYDIATNLSVSDGSFNWNPSDVSNALQIKENQLDTGSTFSSEATLHDVNSSIGAQTHLGSFSVTGYPYLGAASSVGLQWGAIGGAFAIAAVLL